MSYFRLLTFRGPAIIRMDSILEESDGLQAAGLPE